jgi:cytochrome c oxidase subunit 2
VTGGRAAAKTADPATIDKYRRRLEPWGGLGTYASGAGPKVRPMAGERLARWGRRFLGAPALAVGAMVLAGCGTNGFPDPVTESGDETLGLWRLFTFMALAIGGLVYVLVAIIIIRYRRRGSDELPSQQQYSHRIELAYTVIPLLIVAVMFGLTVRTENEVTDLADEPDVVIEVIGYQWQWQFHYPEQDITVQGDPAAFPEGFPTMVIPEGQTVRLKLVANDAIHSFWVPEFLEKRDLIPEIDNEIDVVADETGTWQGRCAEFCGLDHWKMYFAVQSVTPDEFDDWVADQQAAAATTTTADITTTTGGGD